MKTGTGKLVFTGCALALLCHGGQPPDSAERARKLQDMLVAPCCWSESVAQHRSEVAAKMRAEIQSLVASGRTDREILDSFVQQYGKRVLMEPEGSSRALMYTIPVLAVLAGLLLTVAIIRRLAHPRAAPQS